jgi:8-oxo-dGTP pyrophosphatase MutT (NUDIX family)
VLLLSPTNEILLLHRVKTSTSFASAHVFPGGNLDAFHDGAIPEPDSPERHVDGAAYRMGAIRETFEETGILLATKDGALVNLSAEQRDEARKKIHGNKVKFGEFLESIGAVADTGAFFPRRSYTPYRLSLYIWLFDGSTRTNTECAGGLMPFTRWITPTNVPKRFTTQMYLYLLPISKRSVPSEMLIPTPDDGVEHTAAQFAPAQSWLQKAADGSAIIFPPQVYLMKILTRFLTGSTSALEEGPLHYTAQRKKLVSFLRRKVTAETEKGKTHPTAGISWADKVMSPVHLMFREEDNRVVLALDKPGPELEGSQRGGDWERVVLVKFGKGGPSRVEVRMREEVLAEERERESAAKL